MKVGLLASHPIQYHAPWFRGLAKEVDIEVFFAHKPMPAEQATGFGGAFEWDIDLLSGYQHRFLNNRARHPGVNHFFGCDTPEIAKAIRGQKSTSGWLEPTARREVSDQTTHNRERLTDNAHCAFDAFIVCGWNLKCYWQAIRACRRAGIPVLVRGDSQLDPNRPWLVRKIKRIIYPFMLRQFDGFLSPGTRNRKYLLHYGVPEKKIFFVPHFVDNDRFAAQAAALRPSRLVFRDGWNIPSDAFCVLFCGKFIPKKRPLDLVKAAQILLRSRPDLKIHLLFAGSGELGPQLRANCNVVFDTESPVTSETKPPTSFAGFRNQTAVSQAYVAADCLVVPSDYRETWGLVVNEAMASSLPAIVSDAVGCGPDLVGDTFVFSLGNPSQLALRIESLAPIKSGSQNFGTDAATKLQIYSVETAVNATLTAINKSRPMNRPH